MRTFIAIELPEQVKAKLSELQTLLKKSGADVKWIDPHNIHLTLKFLGEIDEAKSAKISGIIEEVAKDSKQFRVNLSSCGAFPKIEFPRVIWIAVDKGDKEIKILAEKLEERTERLGIPREERSFSSHITIGRVKSPANKDKLVRALKETENYFDGGNTEFDVTKITLFKSLLGSGGPTYEPLKVINFTTT